MTLLELTYRRSKTRTAATALLDLAVTEGRSLSAAEQARFDGLLTQCEQIDTAIAEREALRTAA